MLLKSKATKAIALALPLLFAAQAPQAQAADGTISFTGNVSASTCNVAIAGVGTNSNSTVSVVLPTVNTAALATAGAVAGSTPFTISVSACNGSATSFTTLFTPITGDAVGGKLINKTTTGGATNVTLEILSSPATGTPTTVNLNAATASLQQPNGTATTTITNSAGTQNYKVQYNATGAAGPGAVTASLPFTISYN